MATENISLKTRTYVSNRFKNTFVEDNDFHTGFVFIGKSQEYANTQSIDTISDTVKDEKTFWDNMIAAKKISPGDVELVIPKLNWEANTVYKQFDDTIDLEELLTANTTTNEQPSYVVNSVGDVYLCLRNGLSANSTIEPTGDYTSANGFIRKSDDYIWKYLYNVKDSNKFLTNEWIPVPYSTDKVAIQTDYGLNATNLVDGSLINIIVTNPGQNYVHTTAPVTAFAAGETYLTVTSTANLVAEMAVSGTGILSGTHITSISNELNRVFLSTPTTSAGGGSGNNVTFSTRIIIDGDGTEVTTQVVLAANNTIRDIKVVSEGVGYTKANVHIYGSGTNAAARAVLPIKYGHGYSPALELGAKAVMVVKRIGEVDATENGLISTSTSFRQYGLLLDPHKYGESDDIAFANANSVISQTTNITLLAGSLYELDEFIYQGTESNPTFSGFLNSQTSDVIRLTNVYGTIQTGSLITGANSGISRPVVSSTNPGLQPYSGDILYSSNIDKVERSPGQAEEIKFVIKF